MNQQLNRATKRKLEKRTKQLCERIEEKEARCELIRIAEDYNCSMIYQGQFETMEDFAVCISPDGLTYGTKDADGCCELEEYGPDGELLFGWGGDGLDLLKEVSR